MWSSSQSSREFPIAKRTSRNFPTLIAGSMLHHEWVRGHFPADVAHSEVMKEDLLRQIEKLSFSPA